MGVTHVAERPPQRVGRVGEMDPGIVLDRLDAGGEYPGVIAALRDEPDAGAHAIAELMARLPLVAAPMRSVPAVTVPATTQSLARGPVPSKSLAAP